MKTLILLFGKNGMLGNYFNKYLSEQGYNIIAFSREDIDVYDIKFTVLKQFLEKYIVVDDINQQVVVINAIGQIGQTGELDKDKYLSINSVFPHMLAIICKLFEWKFIHPTTDCIYTGINDPSSKNKAYTELNSMDVKKDYIYGFSKGLGEPSYGTVIRCSIIGEELINKYSLIEWIKSQKNKTIKGYTNHYWNGITCLQYAKIVNQIIIDNKFWNGVRHLYSNKSVTKYELAQMVNEIWDLQIIIEKFETEKICDRIIKSKYDLVKDFNIPDLNEQLKELFLFDINNYML